MTFRRLAEDLPDVVYRYRLKPTRGFDYINAAALTLTGYRPEEYYAEPDLGLRLVHPEDRERLTALAAETVEEVRQVELRWIRRDGATLWTEQRFRLLRDEAGELAAIEGVGRDITARKRTEAALERARRARRALASCSRASLRALTEDGLYTGVCRLMVEVIGCRFAWVGLAEEAGERRVRPVAWAGEGASYLDGLRITWGDDPFGVGPTGTAIREARPVTAGRLASDPRFAPWSERALAHGFHSSIALPLADGGRSFGALNLYSEHEEAFAGEEEVELLGELAADLAFGVQALRGQAERRSLEAQLQQAQRMEAVGRLAGGVAHDFNNLLTVVSGFLELALAEPATTNLSAYLREIRDAAERGALLTRQLLAFSRRQASAPQVLAPAAALRGLGDLLRRLLGEDVEVRFDLDPETPPVRIDPAQLEQALLNLAVNSRDAMPDGGHLEVRSRRLALAPGAPPPAAGLAPGLYAALSVRDDGAGIAADALPHIFDPFFTTKEPFKGTGLGLATVYGIVQQAGGAVTVESQPGQGATFTLVLPAARGAGAGEAAAGAGSSILLVEDEGRVRSLVRTLLERSGHRVQEAANGEEALAALAAAPAGFDLLVSDVVMPGMSGEALARKVGSLRPGQRVLLMTGNPAAEALASRDAFAPPVLMKPFSAADLLAAVRRALAACPGGDQEPGEGAAAAAARDAGSFRE